MIHTESQQLYALKRFDKKVAEKVSILLDDDVCRVERPNIRNRQRKVGLVLSEAFWNNQPKIGLDGQKVFLPPNRLRTTWRLAHLPEEKW